MQGFILEGINYANKCTKSSFNTIRSCEPSRAPPMPRVRPIFPKFHLCRRSTLNVCWYGCRGGEIITIKTWLELWHCGKHTHTTSFQQANAPWLIYKLMHGSSRIKERAAARQNCDSYCDEVFFKKILYGLFMPLLWWNSSEQKHAGRERRFGKCPRAGIEPRLTV